MKHCIICEKEIDDTASVFCDDCYNGIINPNEKEIEIELKVKDSRYGILCMIIRNNKIISLAPYQKFKTELLEKYNTANEKNEKFLIKAAYITLIKNDKKYNIIEMHHDEIGKNILHFDTIDQKRQLFETLEKNELEIN